MARKMKSKKKTSAKSKETEGTKDVSELLSEMDETWGETEASSGSFEEVPPGKYQARIDAANVNEAQSSGRLQVTFELTICSGDHKNRKLWKHDGLDNAQSVGYFKGGLERLGVEVPEKSSELPATLEELVGTYAEIKVRHKPNEENPDSPFVNAYFLKGIDEDEVDMEGLDELDADETEEDEDESPKKKKGKKSKKPAPVEEEEDEDDDDEPSFSKGDRVTAEFDDEEMGGKIVKVKGDKAVVLFDDGEKVSMDLSELSPESTDDDEEEDDEEEAPPAKKSKKGKGKKAKPADDDEDEDEEELDDEEEDDEPAPKKKGKGKKKPEPEEEDEEEDDDDAEEDSDDEAEDDGSEDEEEGDGDAEAEVKCSFKSLNKAQKSIVKQMAKRHEFDPDDYDDEIDLLADIAEYFEISGEFKKADDLVKKCQKAEKKKG